MSSLVTVAEILKARQLVVVKSLSTVLELFEDRSPKPKVCVGVLCRKNGGGWGWVADGDHTIVPPNTQLEIILGKSEQFDSVIAGDQHRDTDLQMAEDGSLHEEEAAAA